MANNYIQPGDVLSYIATANIVSGQVMVIGAVLGVSLDAGVPGDLISVKVSGVFELPKALAAVINQGESVVWDVSAGAFDSHIATPATGDVYGAPALAFESAGTGASTLLVKLTGVPGTVA